MTGYEFRTQIDGALRQATDEGDTVHLFFVSNEKNEAMAEIINLDKEDAMSLIRMLKSQYELGFFALLKLWLMPKMEPDQEREHDLETGEIIITNKGDDK